MRPPVLHARLLGPMDLRSGKRQLPPLDSARAESLLAYLLLHRDAPQPRQRLAFLLWPDSAEGQAHTNLPKVLHNLRRALPDADRLIEVGPRTLRWRPDAPLWLDVEQFERAVAGGQLEEAVQLYAGELLEGRYDEWLADERERLAGLHADALERLARQQEHDQRWPEAIRCAERLVAHDPLREESHRLLIQLCQASGDRAAPFAPSSRRLRNSSRRICAASQCSAYPCSTSAIRRPEPPQCGRSRTSAPRSTTSARCPTPPSSRLSTRSRRGTPAAAFTARGEYMPELSDTAIEVFLAHATDLVTLSPPFSQMIIFRIGQGVAAIPDEATAFSHRDASYLFHPISARLDPADGEKMIAAARAFAAAMGPFSTGASYLNFTHEADRVRDAYGDAKYARLVALKDTYDPANLFRLNQNIRPSQPAPEPVLA